MKTTEKNKKLTVNVTVTVPESTSKTKVEKTLRTVLAGVPEEFKVGAPKVVTPTV